jgi:serine/threonine protein kinase
VNKRVQPLRRGDPTKFQGWTLKGFIGEGGQSTIFLAEKENQLAALKMIRKEFLHSQKSVDRFFTEIKNLELLDHPNIAKVLEAEDSGAFVAIQYIDGPNLEDYIKENGPFGPDRWLQTAEVLANTIEYCHSKGIIHKDISPTNIVIGPTGPVLIDFGISYLENDPKLTSSEEVVGTFPFMSPEHFGVSRPHQMDYFSLAGTLIYAGSGHYPFSGETKSEWRDSILSSRPNFEGLIPAQIELLTPLLYKDYSKRLSLTTFARIVNSNISNALLDDGTSKEFSAVKSDSERKLVAIKRSRGKTHQIGKKTIAATIIVALLSIGATAFGIFGVQRISQNSPNLIPIAKSPTPSSIASSASTEPASQKTSPPTTSNLVSSSRECEAEYDRKGASIINLCLPAAKAGDRASVFYLGVTYFSKQNYREAEKWLLIGAKNKDLNSTRYLIDTYTELSNTTERDRWTKICADTSYGATDTSPLKDIAYCKMMQGFILTRAGANKEAILYFTDAAEYGSGDAATWLGVYYRDLDQRDKAIKWLTRAAELDNTKGLNALISYADEIGDNALAKKWLSVSANDGNQVNMGVLAFTYYYEKDFASAKKWASKGASFGDILSIFVQGAVAYDENQRVEGKVLLLKAANKGNIPAIRKLGTIYRLDEKNYAEAAIWYEKLASRNDFTGTAIYSSLLLFLGKDQESCTFNDKVLEIGNQAKKNGTYDATLMDKYMAEAKSTYETWCSQLYKNN